MGTFHALLLVWYTICTFASAAEDSFVFQAERHVVNTDARQAFPRVRKRQSGILPSTLGKSLYWFGNFTVGDSGPLKLLIDTGSSDCYLNPGLYVPSKDAKPYGTGNFSITYEGVNRAGFGFETLNGSEHRDIVSAGGLTVKDQPLGVFKTYKYFDVPQLPYASQGQGIIGFAGKGSSALSPPADSWFYSLCKNKALSECRLGLAFGTSGKGQTIVGKLDSSLYAGNLHLAPRVRPFNSYTILGDVAVNNKLVLMDQTIIMDVGTDNIQGPIAATQQIFKLLGYKGITKTGPNLFDPALPVKDLTAYFECDKPPTIGFSFPAQSELKKGRIPWSSKSKIFNVSPKVWDVYENGKNNCTSILGGTNALTNPNTSFSAWLLGQPFFAGHYLDFDVAARTVGFADLADPATGGST